jgi:hypothetical protein
MTLRIFTNTISNLENWDGEDYLTFEFVGPTQSASLSINLLHAGSEHFTCGYGFAPQGNGIYGKRVAVKEMGELLDLAEKIEKIVQESKRQ